MKRSAASALAAGPVLLVMMLSTAVDAAAGRAPAGATNAVAPAKVAGATDTHGAPGAAGAASEARQARTSARASAQRPAPPARPAPQPASSSSAAAGAINPCDYLDAAEVAPLVGAEATPTSAPSRGAFVSCGYTSATGDNVTISLAEYGLIEVAQQFFARNRDALKTAVKDESFGVPAFSNRSAEQPTRVTYGAVKGSRTVVLEAVGPLASSPQAAGHLKAILTKALAKVPAEAPPLPDEPEVPEPAAKRAPAKPKPTKP